MAGITLEIALAKLDLWLAAHDAIASGQSYTIDNRSLTRANLRDVLDTIDFWQAKVDQLSRNRKIVARSLVARD